MNRVVITGMGVISPNAHGLADFEAALREGRSGIRFQPRLEELSFGCQVAGVPVVSEETRHRYFSESLLQSMNTGILYASLAAVDAWKDAGFEVPPPEDDRVDWDTGAVIGTGVGGVDTLGDKVIPRVNEKKTRRLGSMTVEQTMSSAGSARIGGILGLGGRVTTNSSACTTGTEAVADAYFQIREGRAKRMLAGGMEGASPYIWAGFDAMRVLSREYNSSPEKASRPMSSTAGGFVPSSGAGILLLESLDSALERDVRIYAEVVGAAVNCGGQRQGGSMTAPNPHGSRRCIRSAMSQNQIHPESIDLINGHLTATMADPLEVRTWQNVLERTPERFPWIQSTKSLIGHALGAAGGIECVASVLQLDRGFVHVSANCEDILPELEPFSARIPRKTVDTDLDIVAKASFGFGDVNGCVIFKKWRNNN